MEVTSTLQTSRVFELWLQAQGTVLSLHARSSPLGNTSGIVAQKRTFENANTLMIPVTKFSFSQPTILRRPPAAVTSPAYNISDSKQPRLCSFQVEQDLSNTFRHRTASRGDHSWAGKAKVPVLKTGLTFHKYLSPVGHPKPFPFFQPWATCSWRTAVDFSPCMCLT